MSCTSQKCRAAPQIAPDDVDLTEQFVNRNTNEAEQYLEEVGSRLNCRVRTRVITSKNVGTTLHDIGMHDDIDLVLVSAHGYSGLSRWPRGSLVHGLITYSQVPTLVIQIWNTAPTTTMPPTRR